jgi:glycine/D-amino acid oxidase-like deaminating enzyme
MDSATTGWPDSLWAAMTPAGPELPKLVAAARADVVVIGAGFTGLSAALHLREAGVDVAIIDAMEPGWGASGRNNGQVIPTLPRADPEDIIARHGAVGERFVALLRDSASTLFDLVRRYQIQAEQEQSGWVQPVHSPGRIPNRRTPGPAVVEIRRAGRIAVARPDPRHARLRCMVRRLLEQDRRTHQSARAVARTGACCGRTRRANLRPLACDQF